MAAQKEVGAEELASALLQMEKGTGQHSSTQQPVPHTLCQHISLLPVSQKTSSDQ